MSKVAITGNTYPIKDQIKALGGKWDADQRAWMVPANKAEEAKALVANAPKEEKAKSDGKKRYFAKCADCGIASHGWYRCRDCNMERQESER